MLNRSFFILVSLLLLTASCVPLSPSKAPPNDPNAMNLSPVVSAGAGFTIQLPINEVTLSGSATDPDGDELTYQWSKTSGGPANIISASELVTIVNGLAAGNYIFSLSATDAEGKVVTSEIPVMVLPDPNGPPVADAPGARSITLPTNSITMSGLGFDPDGDPLSYAWTKVSGGDAVIVSPTSASTLITSLIKGAYVFRLTVTDSKGLSHYDDAYVTVNGIANAAPVANAGADKSVTLPTNSVSLAGSATDTNGDAITYTWTKISGGLATITSPSSAATTVTGLVQGAYVFKLRASDIHGAATDDQVNVTVNTAVNAAPVANAGADKIISLPTSSVTLSGSGTDANGDSLTYSWSKVSGGAATIASPTSATTFISGLAFGSYVFRLKVSDAYSSATDDVKVTVNSMSTVGAPPTPVPGYQVWKRDDPAHWSMKEYDAVVFLPADYNTNPTKKYPLILSLYGIGGRVLEADHNTYGGNREGFIKHATGLPAIVIAPEGRREGVTTGNVWWNVDFNKRLIDDAIRFYRVDVESVVVTGLSAGGGGTNDLAVKYTDMFAGVMPIAFTPPGTNNAAFDECMFTDLPMWADGNRDDGTFNHWAWEGLGADSFKGDLESCPNYNNTFKITSRATGGHGGWDTHWAKSEVKNWLITRKRGQNPPY